MADRLQTLMASLAAKYQVELTNNDRLALANKALGKNYSLVDYYSKKIEINEKEKEAIRVMMERLQESYPLQYLLGGVSFCGLDLVVDERVLIPRPETEEIAYEVYELIKRLPRERIIIADIGTGSGAIGLGISHLMQRHQLVKPVVYGIDISSAALEVAAINYQRSGVCDYFLFEGDLLEPLVAQGVIPKVVVANLPYVKSDYPLDENVRYEPVTALDGGADGLRTIERFLAQLATIASKEMIIALEIGYDQAEAVLALTAKYLPGYGFKTSRDLFGNFRQVIYYPPGLKKRIGE